MTPANRGWTYLGLCVALFATPAVALTFKLLGFTRSDSLAVVVRELVILALVGFLFWLIRARERLPLSSIGLQRGPVLPMIFWTIAVLLAFLAALFACLGLVLPALGLEYGGASGPAASLAVTALVVTRAGIAEEVFYRGYAIERIKALTGSTAIAAFVPLILFAAFHYTQGVAGVIVALCVGAVATAFFLWRRNLAVLIVAHFLTDFIPNVAFPMMSGR